jgi:Uma2 family endonuclease
MPPRSEPRLRRWTRKEYYRLADMGFFNGQRVELIHGRIIKVPAMKNPHVAAVSLTGDVLRAAFGPGYWVRTQAPLRLAPLSEPEPDVAVVPGGPRDYTDHPTTALLVVEVSDTTLHFDRRVKSPLYARAGIADYWILNLVQRQLEVFRDPRPDPAQPGRVDYHKLSTLTPADAVATLAVPNATIPVADLLP